MVVPGKRNKKGSGGRRLVGVCKFLVDGDYTLLPLLSGPECGLTLRVWAALD